PNVAVDTSQASGMTKLFTGSLKGTNGSGVAVTLTSHFASVATNPNQNAVATALDKAGNAGAPSAAGATLLGALIGSNSATSAPAAYTSLSGEGLADQQQAALEANDQFVRT